MAKGTVVASNAVKREKGYLYFVDASGNVRRTRMASGGRKKKSSSSSSKAKAAPRKHEGINQRTGRLKKGYRYGSSGRIVKAKGK